MSEPQNLCPFCGAYSPRQCELIEDAGSCPWDEAEDQDAPTYQHKILISAGRLPAYPDGDGAIYRRVRLIPWGGEATQ